MNRYGADDARDQGFTLVELLVAMGLFLMLMSMIMLMVTMTSWFSGSRS